MVLSSAHLWPTVTHATDIPRNAERSLSGFTLWANAAPIRYPRCRGSDPRCPHAPTSSGTPRFRHQRTGAASSDGLLDSETVSEQRALAALEASGIAYRVVRHGRVRSLAEAAAARGLEPAAVIKTIVVRRSDDDYLFVLVPGERTISWPKLRSLLGVSRLSMPDAATAREVTGYERGTITPFGSVRPWPVVADERVLGHEVSIGGGAHGVSATVDGDDLIRVVDATVADVTEPEAAG